MLDQRIVKDVLEQTKEQGDRAREQATLCTDTNDIKSWTYVADKLYMAELELRVLMGEERAAC